MTETPSTTIVLQIAAIVALLPFADPKALARVQAVVTLPDADDTLRGTWARRELDWLPLYGHFGRTRSWSSAKVRTLTPGDILALLEADFGVDVRAERAA